MKKFFVLVLALVMVFSCAAVAFAEDLPTITFYHGYFQDEATWAPASAMRALYEEFAEAHKDEFIFEAVALDTGNEGVQNKVVQELAAGTMPDIVDVSGYNVIPAVVSAGLALDLTPYLEADPEFKAAVGVNIEQNTFEDGKIYTVRDQLETIGFWYNAELFEKAGAKTPEEWTSWADFSEAVDALIACEEVETPFSLNQGWPTTIVLSALLLGSEETRAMATSIPETFDTEGFRSAIEFLTTEVLAKVDNDHFTAGSSDAYREDFFNGKAAMLFNGVWEAGSFGSVAIDPAVIKPAVFPTFEEGKSAAIVSASPGYIINSTMDEAKINACVEFVKFMTSAETAKVIFEKVQAMPPAAIDYDTYAEGEYDVPVKLLAQACKAANGADYQAKTAGATWGGLSDSIAEKYAGLRDGSITVDDVIADLNLLLEDE